MRQVPSWWRLVAALGFMELVFTGASVFGERTPPPASAPGAGAPRDGLDDYRAAYWGMFVLQRIARAFAMEALFNELGQDSIGKVIQQRALDSLFARSKAFEAGTWKP